MIEQVISAELNANSISPVGSSAIMTLGRRCKNFSWENFKVNILFIIYFTPCSEELVCVLAFVAVVVCVCVEAHVAVTCPGCIHITPIFILPLHLISSLSVYPSH